MNLRNSFLLLIILFSLETSEVFAQSKNNNFSYAFGFLIGESLSDLLGLTYKQVDIKGLSQSLVAVLEGEKTPEEIRASQSRLMNAQVNLGAAKQEGLEIPKFDKRISADVGSFYGDALKNEGFAKEDLNRKEFITGVKTSFGKGKTKMTKEEAEAIVDGYEARTRSN